MEDRMKKALFEHGSKEGYIKEINRLEDRVKNLELELEDEMQIGNDLRNKLACYHADQIAKILDKAHGKQ